MEKDDGDRDEHDAEDEETPVKEEDLKKALDEKGRNYIIGEGSAETEAAAE